MATLLHLCGLDTRFVGFAFWCTLTTVALFVLGYVALGFAVETFDTEFLAYVGFSGFVGLLIAMKALPVTFPCALVGWCFGFALANGLWGNCFVAALTGAIFAGIMASCGVVFWMNGASAMPNPDAVVTFAIPTITSALVVAVVIYRPKRERLV